MGVFISDAMTEFFEQNPELFFLLGGCIAAFFMAFLRGLNYTRKDPLMMVTEALMCTMITASISVGANSAWQISYIWTIPVGVMVGFIGTSFIHAIVKKFLLFHTHRLTGMTPEELEQERRKFSRRRRSTELDETDNRP